MKHTLNIVVRDRGKTRRLERKFPAGYEAFTRRDLRLMARWLDRMERDGDTLPEYAARLMRIPKRLRAQVYEELAFYLHDGGEGKLVPELAYLGEPYENENSLMRRTGLWVGPAHRMKNLTLERVAFADMFLTNYAETKDRKFLRLFWAAVHRPALMPWRPRLLGVYAFMARAVRRNTLLAAAHNYRGMVRMARKLYPEAYEGEGGVNRLGWLATLRNLAETGLHGVESKCRKLAFPDGMTTFAFLGIRNAEMKRRMNKSKREK